MNRLIGLLLAVGAFLGGYHLGRMPGSPDVYAWVRSVCRHAPGVAKTSSVAQAPKAQAIDAKARPQPVTIQVGGKTYVIGERYTTDSSDDQ